MKLLLSNRVVISPRETEKRLQSKGLFPTASVSRGNDWIWGDQDGRLCSNCVRAIIIIILHFEYSWRHRNLRLSQRLGEGYLCELVFCCVSRT